MYTPRSLLSGAARLAYSGSADLSTLLLAHLNYALETVIGNNEQIEQVLKPYYACCSF